MGLSDLGRIQNEWLASRQYDDRVDNIVDGSGTSERANGDSFVLPISSDRTVEDDGVADTVTGGTGRDLFFADFGLDIINGRLPNETQFDLR